ncbi:DNA-processing protein DprA [Demequina soli]|uniref:DNA-processing protein DprA n=1 Tax=Demequina soli TaxID=1638987 RepID=UPI0007817E83|nr:DNA-processing protein DprA [Demequina soli]
MDAGDAALVWSAIAEPDDAEAGALVSVLGHEGALAWIGEAGHDPVAATATLASEPRVVDRILRARERWVPRLAAARPTELRERAECVGARVIARGAPGWPAALEVMGARQPHALWVRGDADVDAAWGRSVAVVGSRAATAYGEHVASDVAAVAAERGIAVVSGGAYGIDAAAHRGALAVDGVTIAVLAGGVDRLYPAGNALLLERVIRTGAVVSEQPPGFAPHRQRFLSRNRLIAAAGATVVVEAALRSGALSTARHALDMLRPVLAVPGPLTSAASAGCHRLVRESGATLMSAPVDVLQAVMSLGDALGEDDALEGPDFGSAAERQAYGAIPPRGASAESIALASGLTGPEAATALAGLAARGLAARSRGLWSRAETRETPDKTDNLVQRVSD